jgi:hypothetical protein
MDWPYVWQKAAVATLCVLWGFYTNDDVLTGLASPRKPNSWIYNFVSGQNLESSQTWGFCQCCGSMPLTKGSWFGSGSGSWIRILLFSSLTFKMPKKLIFNTIFSAYYFLKLHLHNFSKLKSQKESQNSRNQGFSYYFCMGVEGSIPLTNGSGSERPKNMWIRWIRIRIRNTALQRQSLWIQSS